MLPGRKLRHVVFNPEDVPAAAPAQPEAPSSKPPKKAKKAKLAPPAKKQPGPIFEAVCATDQKKYTEVLAGLAQMDKVLDEMFGDMGVPNMVFEAASLPQAPPQAPPGPIAELIEGPGDTPNQAAALAMVTTLDSLDGSPWLVATEQGTIDCLAQLCWSLQNPHLGFTDDDGFSITLDQEGRRLFFHPAKPRADFPLEDRFKDDVARFNGMPLADITYWNVARNWGGPARAVTIPVCRASGFRGPPILGTGANSVRRSLAGMGPHCPCHRKFHLAARGDDGRTMGGQDLMKLKGLGSQPSPIDPFATDT